MTHIFKPSQVVLAVPPLCGTMRRAEVEFAAAMVVAALEYHGDSWQPLQPRQIGEAIGELLKTKTEPWHSLNTNPFFRPDLAALMESDYAYKDEDGALVLTEAGYDALGKWVPSPKTKDM